jgi:hypothetical protein
VKESTDEILKGDGAIDAWDRILEGCVKDLQNCNGLSEGALWAMEMFAVNVKEFEEGIRSQRFQGCHREGGTFSLCKVELVAGKDSGFESSAGVNNFDLWNV